MSDNPNQITIDNSETAFCANGRLSERTPDFVYTAAGPVYVTRGVGHLAFNLGVPEQSPSISGYDVAHVRDGRIAVLYTLLNIGGGS